MSNFDYKKYSLENLDNWVHDAMSAGEASPQEIYDVIVGAVKDNYYIYKNKTSEAYELLTLLNGNGKNYLICNKDDKSPECRKAWNDFWEENYYPEENMQYTEEEINAMCDKAALDEEKEKCREYNLREAEYYNKRAKLDSNQDKVIKWQLPVEMDGLSGEYYVNFPDDLLEAANLKEGDTVNWVDNKDGTYTIVKVTTALEPDEC